MRREGGREGGRKARRDGCIIGWLQLHGSDEKNLREREIESKEKKRSVREADGEKKSTTSRDDANDDFCAKQNKKETFSNHHNIATKEKKSS